MGKRRDRGVADGDLQSDGNLSGSVGGSRVGMYVEKKKSKLQGKG